MLKAILHDLNNILTVVSGSVTLLRIIYNNKNYQNIPKIISMLEQQMKKIEQLTFGYMDKNYHRPLLTDIDTYSKELMYFKSYLNNFHKNINLNISVKQKTVFKINSVDFDRIILNIIKNSVEAIGNQKGIINISFDVEVVEKIQNISCSSCSEQIEGEYGTCTIENSGEKIKNPKNIFRKNYSTKNNSRGLGLYIVHSLLHMVNGHITAKNKEPGVEFKIYIPCGNGVVK